MRKGEPKSHGEYAVGLVARVLFGGNFVPPPGTDYYALFDVCSRHSVANIACLALDEAGVEMPEKVAERFRREYKISVFREAQQELEAAEISRAFEKAGVDFMFLKGSVIKYLYPAPDLRTMCDLDILIDNTKFDEVKREMTALGYELKAEGELFADYEKKPFMRIEIHGRLFDNGVEIYDNYFGTDFRRTRRVKGWEHCFELPDNDFFVFMMAHMAKHYFLLGTGIRSVADVKIFLDAKEDFLDLDYINAEMKKIELLEFSEEIISLAETWFGNGKKRAMSDSIAEYLISSGVYGDRKNAYTKDLVQATGGKNNLFFKKLKYIITYVFPGRRFMAVNYPRVRKTPLLLPYYWMRRLFSSVLKGGRKSAMKRIKMVLRAKQENVEAYSLNNGINARKQ